MWLLQTTLAMSHLLSTLPAEAFKTGSSRRGLLSQNNSQTSGDLWKKWARGKKDKVLLGFFALYPAISHNHKEFLLYVWVLLNMQNVLWAMNPWMGSLFPYYVTDLFVDQLRVMGAWGSHFPNPLKYQTCHIIICPCKIQLEHFR